MYLKLVICYTIIQLIVSLVIKRFRVLRYLEYVLVFLYDLSHLWSSNEFNVIACTKHLVIFYVVIQYVYVYINVQRIYIIYMCVSVYVCSSSNSAVIQRVLCL